MYFLHKEQPVILPVLGTNSYFASDLFMISDVCIAELVTPIAIDAVHQGSNLNLNLASLCSLVQFGL